jgi:predicted nucleic acid-binding protein
MTPTSFSCVVDASVAAQLYVPEPLTSQAVALFGMLAQANAAFHVPDLFYAECANIFWKKVQRVVCTPAESTKALSNILALPLRSTPALDLAVDALALALAQSISAYDGCYVTLAQRLGAALITADQKLEQKLAPAGLPVTWLGAWTPPTPTP